MAWTIIIIFPLPAGNGVLVSPSPLGAEVLTPVVNIEIRLVHVDQHVGSCFLLGFRGGQVDEVLADACFTLFRNRVASCRSNTRSPYV